MDPRWLKLVIDYWTISSNKVKVLKMKGLPYGKFGIINIYALNNLTKATYRN
jgi:hypothetical protein